MLDPPIISKGQQYNRAIQKNKMIASCISNSKKFGSITRRGIPQRSIHSNSVENKLLGIVSKSQKHGKLDKWDTLLFNTYYNTLVGVKEIDINKLCGSYFDKRRASTSSTRSKLKEKKVRWADENSMNKKKRNSMTESSGLQKLSRLIYEEINIK